MAVELGVRHAIVLGPGDGAKALLDELVVAVLPRGISATPHLHRAHMDVFYALEGEIDFAGRRLAPGDLGFAPAGTVHWFDAHEATFVNVHAPGSAWKHRYLAPREGRAYDNETIDSFDVPDGVHPEPVVVAAGEGEQLVNDKRTITFKIARPELCVFEFDSAPGATGPMPHAHHRHVDAFFVLEGELEFELDGESVRAETGTFVAATPGVVHTFRNAGDARVRFLNLHAPGMGYDEYFRRQAAGESGRRFHESFDSYDPKVT